MIIKDKLRRCFEKPLPGLEAQLKMAPLHREEELKLSQGTANAIKSSVLILIYEKSGQEHIVFIRRPVYTGVHSGQIALPGGRWETTDKSLYHTALREANEEIGIQSTKVSYFGKLTDLYIPPSNFIVCPFVGIYNGAGVFTPDPLEVAEIIEVPLSLFLAADSVKYQDIKLSNGLNISTPCFNFRGNIIWGATAMIISEFITLLKSTV